MSKKSRREIWVILALCVVMSALQTWIMTLALNP
jgi:hypothetical protein